jgi:hypothetical protein
MYVRCTVSLGRLLSDIFSIVHRIGREKNSPKYFEDFQLWEGAREK